MAYVAPGPRRGRKPLRQTGGHHISQLTTQELKIDEFEPEHAGKMNFYLSAVDDLLRHAGDAPSIGLILCKRSNRVVVEYALRDTAKPMGVATYEVRRGRRCRTTSRGTCRRRSNSPRNWRGSDEEGE